ATIPTDTSLKFQIRTADTKSNLFSKKFVGPNGTENSYYTISGDSIWLGHNNDRFLQYKLNLSTTNTSKTPILNDVIIIYNLIPLPPTPIAPPNAQWLNNSKPTFSWKFNDLDNEIQVAFNIEIDDDSNFESVDYGSGNINSSKSFWSPMSPITDGTWYWRVRTKDSDCDWGQYSLNWIVKIDTKQPYSLKIKINDGASLTTDRNVLLSLSAFDDDSGIDKMCFSNDGFVYSQWENFCQTKIWELSSGLGEKKVYFKVKDKAGNEALHVNASIIYDPTAYDFLAPEITNLMPKDGDIIDKQRPTISANYSDENTGNSGIDTSSIVLKIDDNDFTASASVSSTGICFIPLEPLSEGKHTVYLEVKDNSRNKNLASKNWSFIIVKSDDFGLAYIRVFPQAATLKVGEEQKFIAEGYDRNNVTLSNLVFTWSVTGNIGEIDNNGSFIATDIGIGVLVAECQGKLGMAYVYVVEAGREIPIAAIDEVIPNPAKENEEIYFCGHGNSSEGIVCYEWISSINGFLSNESCFKISNISVGNHTISFRVKDKVGLWSSAVSIKLEVVRKEVNRAPVVGIIDVHRKINAGESILIKTIGSIDYDGDALQFFFEFGDGHNSGWVDESSISHVYEKKGKYILKFKVRDIYALESNWSPEVEIEVKEKTIVKKQIYDFLWLFIMLLILICTGAYIVYRIKKKVVQKAKEKFTIEDTFLIYKDDGRLIQHTTRRLKPDMDEEIFASMLTAIREFVKDSLGKEEVLELGGMEYGENKILFESGKYVIIAVVISGKEPIWLKEDMKDVVRNIEAEYASVLPSWDGTGEKLTGLKRFLTDLCAKRVLEEVEEKPKVYVQLICELEFYEGFVRLKIASKNNSEAVVTNSILKVIYNEEALRFDHMEPEYQMKGGEILLGNIETKEKKTIAIYFDPQICMESYIDATLTFKDCKGNIEVAKMRRKKVAVVCPIMHTDENINTAMLKRLIEEELVQKDSKIFTMPNLEYEKVFQLAKRAIQRHDVKLVREFFEKEPYSAESWYFGKIKERKDKVVIRASVREESKTIEFFVASDSILVITGLLAELRKDFMEELKIENLTTEQVIDKKIVNRIIGMRKLIEKSADVEIPAQEVSEKKKVIKIYCPNCKLEIKKGWKRCPYCMGKI
ncbi:MAG: PKD domain-containing protein, partial [Candidatus Thermoplasmatota archaeon]